MSFCSGAVRLGHLHPDTLGSVPLLVCIPVATTGWRLTRSHSLGVSGLAQSPPSPWGLPWPASQSPCAQHVHTPLTALTVALPLYSWALLPHRPESFLRKSPSHPSLCVSSTSTGPGQSNYLCWPQSEIQVQFLESHPYCDAGLALSHKARVGATGKPGLPRHCA